MKILKLILAMSVLAFAFSLNASAQRTENYAFTSTNTGSLENMSTGTTSLLTPATYHDDDASAVTPVGFTFYFMGTAYTQFSINSNGQMRLGATAISGGEVPLGSAGQALIVPMSDDNSVQATGKVHYKVVGAAGSRVLIVEWLDFRIPFDTVTGTFSRFQVLLSETTSVIQFKYGTVYNNSPFTLSRSIGFSSDADKVKSVMIAAAPTASDAALPISNNFAPNSAVANLSSAADGSRRVYTFTPPSGTPNAPTAISFTGVTPNSTTVNWIDSSTNESQFQVFRSTDGVSYALVATVDSTTRGTTGTPYSFTNTGLSPGTLYNYRIRAVNEGGPSSANLNGSQTTAAAPTITCNPAGGNYSAGATWVGGTAPTAAENANITGCTVTIDAATNAANTVTVGSGGVLQYGAGPFTLTANGGVNVQAGGQFTAGAGTSAANQLNVGGTTAGGTGLSSFVINGSVNFDGTAKVNVTFFGSQNASISGTGATAAFYNIVVNKGASSAAIQDVNRVITLNAPTTSPSTRLTITSGTFRLNSASTLAPYCGSQTIAAANGRLWIASSAAIVGSNGFGTAACQGSPTVTGVLQVSDGEFRYGAGGNTLSTASTNTSGLVIGGANTLANELRDGDTRRLAYDEKGDEAQLASTAVVRILGAVAVSGNFTMTEGNLFIDPQATNNLGGAADTFSTSTTTCTTCSQTVTGGTITIIDPPAATNSGRSVSLGASSATPAGNINWIGSTIVLGDGASAANGNTTNGFTFDTFAGTRYIYLGNVVVGGGNAAGRFARAANSSVGGAVVNGTLTVNAGSELRLGIDTTTTPQLCINGTLLNNGTIIALGRLYFGCGANATNSAEINLSGAGVPILTNNGTIQRAVGDTSANFARLIFNTSGGMTLPAANFTVSDVLEFRNGVITVPSANKISAVGAVGASRTNGWVNGRYEKVFGSGSSTLTQLMPIGSAIHYTPVTFRNIVGQTTTTAFAASQTDAALPDLDTNNVVTRRWTLTPTGTFSSTTIDFTYVAADVVGSGEAFFNVFRRVGGINEDKGGSINVAAHTATVTGITALSDWGIGESVVLSANGSISGRVLAAGGSGIRNAVVQISGGNLTQPRIVRTGSFGYYQIDDLELGETYVVTVMSKRFTFANPSVVVNLQENIGEIDFEAEPE